IPIASIERIVILSSAGSAIYGINATGGVVNIITRQDYQGGRVSLSFATPLEAMRPKRTAHFNYAMPVGWGTSLSLAGSYSSTEPPHGGDVSEKTIERWRTLAMERDPGKFMVFTGGNPLMTSTLAVYGATPNIHTATGSNLFSSAGGPASNFTTVP